MFPAMEVFRSTQAWFISLVCKIVDHYATGNQEEILENQDNAYLK